MKKIKKLLFVGLFPVLALTMGSCTDYQDEVDALNVRVDNLYDLVNKANETIRGISTLVSAAENGWIITNMENVPAERDPQGVGYYTINFGKIDPATGKMSNKPEDKKTITIYNGKDASQPMIEVRKGEDGNFYWYIDGKPMVDPDTGKPVKANGRDGNDGKAPILNIDGEGYWMISYDDGVSYVYLTDGNGKRIKCTGANGKDADPAVKAIVIRVDIYGNRYAEFDLGGGQIVLVPIIDNN